MSADQDPATEPEYPQSIGDRAVPDRSSAENTRKDDPTVPPDEDHPTDEAAPGPPPTQTTDVETAFAELIAHLSDPVEGGVGPWPAAEDADTSHSAGSTDEEDTGDEPNASGQDEAIQGTAPDGTGPQVLPILPYSLLDLPGAGPDDDEPLEEFVPPDPPPLPRGDRNTRLAWYGLLGGPAFLLLSAMFYRDLPTWMLLGAVGAFVAGFVALVARLPSEPPDDPDDGAIV